MPESIQKTLIKRQARELANRKLWKELVAVSNPFADRFEFAPMQPRLADVTCSERARLGLFTSIMLVTVLVPLLMKGSEGADGVEEVVTVLATSLEEVDYVELQEHAAPVHAQALSACRALQAILSDHVSAKFQDPLPDITVDRRHLSRIRHQESRQVKCPGAPTCLGLDKPLESKEIRFCLGDDVCE